MFAEKLDMNPILCESSDLIANSGVCALVNGEQVALFYLPEESPSLYAVQNYDPIGKANVMSRGIVGDIGGDLVVASPLYKQHFRLEDGTCVEDESVRLKVYPVALQDNTVVLLG